jgi:hypothetical protein
VTGPLNAIARRFADAQSDRLAGMESSSTYFVTVASVTAGAASDGNALVTVTWRGNTVAVQGYYASYTPAVGHRVEVGLTTDNQLVIRGRVIGQP